jgi:hypothetical protein
MHIYFQAWFGADFLSRQTNADHFSGLFEQVPDLTIPHP